MKIAIICDPIDLDQKTGIPVYCQNLIKNIIKLDNTNEYIFFHMRKNILLEGKNEIILPNSSKNNLINSFYMIFKKFILIPYCLHKNKIDIVHELNHIGPFAFDIFRKYKTATTLFDLTPFLLSQYHDSINVRGNKFFLGKTLNESDRIITISENTKEDAIKVFPFLDKDKIITTYLGTDILERKEDESLHFDFPFILSVGTLEPRKNLRLLVKAFIKLKEERNIPEKLVLVGKKGWKIEGLFEELSLNQKYKDDIMLTGFISDEQLVHLYKTCKVFIYPSLYEGFGLPVLEAMTVGAPVITSNISSLPEVVGENGTTIDPNNELELADKLYSLLNDDKLRQDNIQNGLERAKLFSWENCAKETIEIYEKLYQEKSK